MRSILACAVASLFLSAPCMAAEADAAPAVYSKRQLIEALQPSMTYRGLTVGIPGGNPARPAVNLKVEFEFNSAKLTPQARDTLDQLGAALTADELKVFRFRIAGHTDAMGGEDYNTRLSRERADAVKAYLQSRFQVKSQSLETIGYGKSQLLDPSQPTSQINRRVEIINLGDVGS